MGGKSHPDIKKAAQLSNVSLKGKQKSVTQELLEWADILIITADNLPISLFKDEIKKSLRIMQWKIPDFTDNGTEPRKEIISQIKKKIQKLIKQISKST